MNENFPFFYEHHRANGVSLCSFTELIRRNLQDYADEMKKSEK